MAAVLEQHEGSLPSLVVPIALFVQVIHRLQEHLVRRIGQRSKVCDAEALDALFELCLVVAQQF